MPVIPTHGGAVVILDGEARQIWRRHRPGKWQLDAIWPSRSERARLLRDAHAGRPTLVIHNSVGEFVDVLDEEIGPSRELAGYITERDRGVSTLFVPALDWLPRGTSRAARLFLGEALAATDLGSVRGVGVLTPPLGRKRNFRVLHCSPMPGDDADPEWAADLIGRTFPHLPRRRKTDEPTDRVPRHSGDTRDDHRHHRRYR